MFGYIGKLFLEFMALVLALGLLGGWMHRRDAKKRPGVQTDEDEFFSEKEVGNVQNLNDWFNRARYMDEDGQ